MVIKFLFFIDFQKKQTIFKKCSYYCSISSSLSSSFGVEFMQPDPLQFPHTMKDAIPCVLQEHLMVPQSVWQLHRMIRRRSSGAGNKSVVTGTNISSLSLHPHSSSKRPSPAPFHSCTW